jgi:hypothetical protein
MNILQASKAENRERAEGGGGERQPNPLPEDAGGQGQKTPAGNPLLYLSPEDVGGQGQEAPAGH